MRKKIFLTMLATLILALGIGLVAVNAEENTPEKYITIDGFYGELPNGEESYLMEVENYGDTVILPENTFVREDNRFIGWEYNCKFYQPGDEIVAEEDGIVTAVYIGEEDKGVILFNPQMQSWWTYTYGPDDDETMLELSPACDDFSSTMEIDAWFEGWNTEPDGSGTYYDKVKLSKMADKEILKLYAIWNTDLSQAYKVTIDPNFDDGEDGWGDKTGYIYTKKGDAMYADISVAFSGYEFAGFYDKPEGGKYLCSYYDWFTPKEDTVLYAHWTKQSKITLDAPSTLIFDVADWETPGTETYLGVWPVWNYALKSVSVKDDEGKAVKLKKVADFEDYYTFTMPDSDVIVSAEAELDVPENVFKDVREKDYFYEPVLWALKNDVTTGVAEDLFGSKQTVTRAQMITFLWRLAESPEPDEQGNIFTDVEEDDYYYKAVLWAYQSGITKGTSETKFSPESMLTRAQAVTLMARYDFVYDDEDFYTCDFADVKDSDYFKSAVGWACSYGITTGTDATHFSPNENCLRSQVVTFLFRDFAVQPQDPDYEE